MRVTKKQISTLRLASKSSFTLINTKIGSAKSAAYSVVVIGLANERLFAIDYVDALARVFHLAALQVVNICTLYSVICYLLNRSRVCRLDRVEWRLLGKLELAIACPVEREAYETHCVATEDSVLLIVYSECTVGEYNSCAVGRASWADGLRGADGSLYSNLFFQAIYQ